MGFQICGIAGTSAGGMAGAVYAAGYSPGDVIRQIASVSQEDMYGFGRGPGLLDKKGIKTILNNFLGDKTFADLKIPCAMTAVDLIDMKELTLSEGSVLDAVLATISVPGVFAPHQYQDRLLVDGMVLNPVPVALARSLAPKLPVVAVSLSPEPERWKQVSPWDEKPANPLLRPISRLRIAKAFEVYLRSADMTIHMLGEKRLEIENPEVLLRPDVGHIGSLDKVDIPEIAALGDQAVAEAADKLARIKKRRRWFSR
jgi:NTE family protein